MPKTCKSLREASDATIIQALRGIRTASFVFGILVFIPRIPSRHVRPLVAQTAVTMASADRAKLKAALSAYDEGKLREAQTLLENLLRRYPNSFEATETLGLIEIENGNAAPGTALLEKAAGLQPSSVVALSNLGAAYLKLNRAKDAVRVLERSVAIDPKEAESQSALGQALMLTGNPASAADAFSQAAALGLSSPDLLYNWALALFNAGSSARAAEVLSRVRNKDASPSVQVLLGDIEEKQGNFERAVEHLQTAAKLNPSEANLFALGIEFARHWTFEAAIRVFEFGTSKFPSSRRLQLGLGISRYGNNDYAGAALIFSRLLDSDPENATYADLLGQSCSVIAEHENTGCDKLIAFAQQHPQNAAALTFAAASILKQPSTEQDLAFAARLLHQAIAANPKYADAYLELGVLDQQMMRWQESISVLEKAIVLSPRSPQAHYRLARAYSHLGRREEAQQEIALRQKYAQAEKDALDSRLRNVTTFLVALK